MTTTTTTTTTTEEIQTIANSFARKNGHGRATKVTLSAAVTVPMIGETTRYGYRKHTTGDYVSNKYRSNYGWKNTYYQAAECEVILPASILV
jgi:hypothetical protein